MDSNLLTLLRKIHNGNSDEYTHTTSYGPSNRWSVRDNAYGSFWLEYCRMINSNIEGNFCLSEIPQKYMPVILDFSLKFDAISNPELNKNIYDLDFLYAVVYCVQQVMISELNIERKRVTLISVILTQDLYVEDNILFFNFRLQFPYCKTLQSTQKRILRPMILQMLRTENVFSKLARDPINNWDDILNPTSVELPVTLYGSSNTHNNTDDSNKLKLECIVGEIGDYINLQIIHLTVDKTFIPEHHPHINSGLLSQASIKSKDKEFWLPIFLSIYYYDGMTVAKEDKSDSVEEIEDIEEDETAIMANTFLNMLSMDRVECDHFWIDVGKALFGTFEGSDVGLKNWIKFTERSDNHTPEECTSLYYTYTNTHLTIKTLAWYAREDAPEDYKRWHVKWYTPSLEKATSCLHSDVAEALYKIYWLEFACSSLSKGKMYQYKNDIWKPLDGCHTLRKYISDDFLKIFERFRTNISLSIQESTDTHFKSSAEVTMKKIGLLINKLKNRTFKNNMLSESFERFHVENFILKLDSNPDLMGMANGVLEAGDTKAVMRRGKPEDFISRSTSIMWRNDLHYKHPLVLKLLDWIRKVFPNKELLEYFGKISASCIRGRNSDKLFPIMTGCGDNSKSMIKKLFECAFGNYCITFPTSLFTDKRKGGPSPAVARSKYAHIAFVQEPDADNPLKNGTIKEMTGGDRFFTRFLNDNGGEIEPTFTLILMCNTTPMIPHSDNAMKNRVRLIPYLSTWVNNPPKSLDEQFKVRKFQKDPFFEKQIPELAPAFLWWLIKMYSKYIKEGLKEPELVLASTKEYWDENDMYKQFIDENLTKAYKEDGKTIDEESKITLSELYTRFREWFRECFPGLKCPDRPLLKSEMVTKSRLGKTYRRAWRGYKFKVNVVDI